MTAPRHPFRAALDAAGPSLGAQGLWILDGLGILDALAGPSPQGVEILANAAGLGVDRLTRLLDALVADGILTRDPTTRFALAPSAPAPAPPNGDLAALPGILRVGRPLDPGAHTAAYHRALADAAERVATELLATEPAALRGEILDLGGGMGGYARAILAALPAVAPPDAAPPEVPPRPTRITLVDAPAILALAATHLEAHAARIDLVAADLRDFSARGSFDAALLCDVLHHLAPGAAQRLVAEAARCLRPAGALVLVERSLDPDRRGPRAGLWFDVFLSLYTREGRLYDRDTISGWLAAAGLVAEARSLACDPDATLWLAHPTAG